MDKLAKVEQREEWVEPEIRVLAVDETAYEPGAGHDAGAYSSSQRS